MCLDQPNARLPVHARSGHETFRMFLHKPHPVFHGSVDKLRHRVTAGRGGGGARPHTAGRGDSWAPASPQRVPHTARAATTQPSLPTKTKPRMHPRRARARCRTSGDPTGRRAPRGTVTHLLQPEGLRPGRRGRAHAHTLAPLPLPSPVPGGPREVPPSSLRSRSALSAAPPPPTYPLPLNDSKN